MEASSQQQQQQPKQAQKQQLQEGADDSLLVDISDALSERDRVRFTVHTRTKLPQFSKPVLSVVRQHEEFIWLHDCLVENDQYAGYIIPPPPPKPDFDSSREKLQRLGDCEASLTKEEFAKMKQELEAEYLAIFKKTVAMHEIFLQRLASHSKFRDDGNFKIFLEYENELAVRGKSKREKIAGSISNIGKSLTDFVITTSQVANTNSISGLTGGSHHHNLPHGSTIGSTGQLSITSYGNNNPQNTPAAVSQQQHHQQKQPEGNNNNDSSDPSNSHSGSTTTTITTTSSSNTANPSDDQQQQNNSSNNNHITSNTTTANNDNEPIDEQYFERERLFLALYYNSIRETAHCADKVSQAHKCVADSYLNMAQQFVRLASIEVVPITAKTAKDISSSGSVAGPLPSLTLPNPPPTQSTSTVNREDGNEIPNASGSNVSERAEDEEISWPTTSTSSSSRGNSSTNKTLPSTGASTAQNDKEQGDTSNNKDKSTGGCANEHTSDGLKKLLLNVSDYLEQARKIEARIASDEDLKLTDTFLYYKRDTVAAQELLTRRLRFMSEYETATKNLEKSRLKGRTAMQYAEVIQKQAHENFMSISRLAKQELIDYKKRRIGSFRKAFIDLAELETKHLRSHQQLIMNCLNLCRGVGNNNNNNNTAPTSTTNVTTSTSSTTVST